MDAYKKVIEAQEAYKRLLNEKPLIKKRPWRFILPQKRWYNEWHDLNVVQRSIMVDLEFYARNRRTCYPSMRRLSEDLKLDLTTIQRNIKKLVQKGFIKINKAIDQRGKFNLYTILK